MSIMSKMVITESELNRLILESINEELEDEGWLSNFAGRAYEWGKNKFNNMSFFFTRIARRINNI